MALFGKKKTETAAAKSTAPAKPAVDQALIAPKHVSAVVVKPRITEKAALMLDKNVYTFEVSMNASKYDVRDAIKKMYDVTPIKVRTTKKNPRHYVSRMRGRSMMEKGYKKAYVYLKEGDRIDLA